MGKKPNDELPKLVIDNLEQLSRMRPRSETAEKRSRLYLQLLLVAVKYPRTLPKDLTANLIKRLIKFDEDEDVRFVRDHFTEHAALVHDEDSDHAALHAEEFPIPKEFRNKK